MELPARMRFSGLNDPDSDPTVQRLLEASRRAQLQPLRGRERTVVLLSAVAFIGVAVPFAILAPGERALDPAVAAVLVAMYAVAARVEFHTGSGWTVPTQLVFVPMLFLLPVSVVPLFVAAGLLLFKLPEYLTAKVHPDRSLVQFCTAWYAVGPAAVLALAGEPGPAWSDWPLYLAALGAQFGFDFASSSVTECLGYGLKLRENLRELRDIYIVDALLSPIGLLAAFVSVDQQWAFLLVLPLLGLLAMFAREREARIENALTLSKAYRGTAHLLGEVLSTTDEYTGKHSRSVVVFSHQVGQAMGLGERDLRDIEFAALLHDVGKMSIPNKLLNKPGSLDEGEWAVMKTHTTAGEQMLTGIGGALADVGRVVRSHHERWDGGGYPDGLRGEEIPVAARVVACCDAYHAMTSDRPYRLAMSREAAIEEMRDCSGTQFDPVVVEALINLITSWDLAPGARRRDSNEVPQSLSGLATGAR